MTAKDCSQGSIGGRRSELDRKYTAPKVRLSCELCRQRKVKCDKLSPCTNCQKLGTICVPVERARLPRGRFQKTVDHPAGPDADLKGRMARVEQLLRELKESNNIGTAAISEHIPQAVFPCAASQSNTPAPVSLPSPWNSNVSSKEALADIYYPITNAPTTSECLEAWKPKTYPDNPFWQDLMPQTQGMRDISDPCQDDMPHMVEQLSTFDAALFGMTTTENLPNSLMADKDTCVPQIQEHLYRIFMAQVDPVFKILHRPSLHAFLQEGKPYLRYDLNHPAPEALKYAVYYTAACSISESQWPSSFAASRATVIAKYQKETEAALVGTEFVTTNDLTVLQAFVFSLIGARLQDQSRRAWTMLSMALRIAQALYLHVPDPPFSVEPLELELRRRLWSAIGMLDAQASLDRATEPMILTSWLQSHPPSNINDHDIGIGAHNIMQDPEALTDTTFSLVVLKAQCAVRSLNFGGVMELDDTYMHVRQACVLEFQEAASRLLRNCQTDAVPFHWYTRQVADCITAFLQLIVLRPIRRNSKFEPHGLCNTSLLKLAVGILEKTKVLYSDPRGCSWRWFEPIFVPWHALAVAIAELCTCDDLELMEKYWSSVEQAFGCFSALVAGSQRGMLWKPVETLMAQAQSKRDALKVADLNCRSPGKSSALESDASTAPGWPSPGLFPPTVIQGTDERLPNATPPVNDLDPWSIFDM